MLGVFCCRSPKPWILSSLSSSPLHHHHHTHPLPQLQHQSAGGLLQPGAGAVSVWHGAGDWRRDFLVPVDQRRRRGEGSWNVAWDARPARWIHRLDLDWLLFGVCAFLAPLAWTEFVRSQAKEKESDEIESGGCDENEKSSDCGYRVTGVLADGRCLFRAIVHGTCLQNGEESPDENRQKELADELRAKVVDELLKRRKETEWFIEGDFDAYVKRIQQPFVWGGEPELLMASHVLKTPIAVYMRDKSSGNLSNIATYGDEYKKDKEVPINVLFHGYGHYDLLETSSNQRC